MKKILSIILVFSLLISGAFAVAAHACSGAFAKSDTMGDLEKEYYKDPYYTNLGFYAYPIRSGNFVTSDGQVFTSEAWDFKLTVYQVTNENTSGYLEFRWHVYNEDKSIEFYAPVMTFLYGLNDEIKPSETIIDTTEYYRSGCDKATHIYSYEDWTNFFRENYELSYNGNLLFTVPTSNRETDYSEFGFIENISDELLLEIFQLAAYSYMFKPVPRGEVFAEKSMMTLR